MIFRHWNFSNGVSVPRVKIEFKIEEVKLFMQRALVIVGSSRLKRMHLSDCQLTWISTGGWEKSLSILPQFTWPEA